MLCHYCAICYFSPSVDLQRQLLARQNARKDVGQIRKICQKSCRKKRCQKLCQVMSVKITTEPKNGDLKALARRHGAFEGEAGVDLCHMLVKKIYSQIN